jgi:hypothetical protein
VPESDEEFFERHMAGLSRRALLGGAFAGGLLAAFGLQGQAAFAVSAPTTAGGVVSLARSYVGDTLATVRDTTSGAWADYGDNDWCAWFASWCTRGLGFGMLTWAAQMRDLGPEVSTPAVGDLVVFGTSHTGIVSKIVNGVPWLIDGNGVSTGSSITTRKVAERPVWSDSHTFTRPAYTDTETGGNAMAAFLKATDQTDVWYLVEEFGVRKITSHDVALRFGQVYPGGSIKVPTSVVNEMIAHVAANRASLVADIAAAVNGA